MFCWITYSALANRKETERRKAKHIVFIPSDVPKDIEPARLEPVHRHRNDHRVPPPQEVSETIAIIFRPATAAQYTVQQWFPAAQKSPVKTTFIDHWATSAAEEQRKQTTPNGTLCTPMRWPPLKPTQNEGAFTVTQIKRLAPWLALPLKQVHEEKGAPKRLGNSSAGIP